MEWVGRVRLVSKGTNEQVNETKQDIFIEQMENEWDSNWSDKAPSETLDSPTSRVKFLLLQKYKIQFHFFFSFFTQNSIPIFAPKRYTMIIS